MKLLNILTKETECLLIVPMEIFMFNIIELYGFRGHVQSYSKKHNYRYIILYDTIKKVYVSPIP